MIHKREAYDRSVANYLAGFAASVVLSGVAFWLVGQVSNGSLSLSRGTVLLAITVLACLQLLVQVVYFLHMSTERKARWSLLSGLFALMVVLILVIGSIWVMNNLNYNMMPRDMTHYMQDTESVHE